MNPSKLILAFVLVSLPVYIVNAAGAKRQWTSTEKSLFQLVEAGYEIVGYTNNVNPYTEAWGTHYLLRKNDSVYACYEFYLYESELNFVGCEILAEPYDDEIGPYDDK